MSSLDGYNDRYQTTAPGSMPTTSWWLDGDRFYERSRGELPRMAVSKFGKMRMLTTAAREDRLQTIVEVGGAGRYTLGDVLGVE
jgi:hypothetical protein